MIATLSDYQTRPLRIEEEVVVALLSRGVTSPHQRLSVQCVRALRSIGSAAVEDLRSDAECPGVTESERDALIDVVRGITPGQLPDRTVAYEVGRAVLESLCILDPDLNARGADSLGFLHPSLVDWLIKESGSDGMSPEHCLQLLEGIERDGGNLLWRSAEMLMRLQKQPVCEAVTKKAASMTEPTTFLDPLDLLGCNAAPGVR